MWDRWNPYMSSKVLIWQVWFYYIPEKPIIPQFEPQSGIPELHHEDETGLVTLDGEMVDALNHTDGIIDDDLGGSSGLHGNA